MYLTIKMRKVLAAVKADVFAVTEMAANGA